MADTPDWESLLQARLEHVLGAETGRTQGSTATLESVRRAQQMILEQANRAVNPPVTPVNKEQVKLKAERLLRRTLPFKEYWRYKIYGHVLVRGSKGGLYRLTKKQAYGVIELYPKYRKICTVPADISELDPADHIVAQYLALINDEKKFVKLANIGEAYSNESAIRYGIKYQAAKDAEALYETTRRADRFFDVSMRPGGLTMVRDPGEMRALYNQRHMVVDWEAIPVRAQSFSPNDPPIRAAEANHREEEMNRLRAAEDRLRGLPYEIRGPAEAEMRGTQARDARHRYLMNQIEGMYRWDHGQLSYINDHLRRFEESLRDDDIIVDVRLEADYTMGAVVRITFITAVGRRNMVAVAIN